MNRHFPTGTYWAQLFLHTLNLKWCFTGYVVHYIMLYLKQWAFKIDRTKKKKTLRSTFKVCDCSQWCVCVCEFVVLFRRGSGCRWWGTWGPAWSWRRCRNGSITLCPSSFSSHPTRCSWTTSAPNATHCAKSWWIKYTDRCTQTAHRSWNHPSALI